MSTTLTPEELAAFEKNVTDPRFHYSMEEALEWLNSEFDGVEPQLEEPIDDDWHTDK